MPDTVSLTATILGQTLVDIDDLPWTEGTTLLSAMEAAQDSGDAPGFTFVISYYGEDLGYLLYQVNSVGDQPCVYWAVAINGQPPHIGLDKQQLNAGDAVTLTFAWCGPNEAANDPLIAAKFQHERLNPALQVPV
jgi:Domain of unknown function (DUF4430)